MRQLTREDIRALGDGNHQLWVRCSKHTRGPTPQLIYEGPASVYLRLRKKAYKHYPVGQILTLGLDIEEPWAEYGESAIDSDGTCNSEEYLAELFDPSS